MSYATTVAAPAAKRAAVTRRDYGAQVSALRAMHADMVGHAALDGRPDLDVGDGYAHLYLWCSGAREAFEVVGLLLQQSRDAGLSLGCRPSESPLNAGEWSVKVSAVEVRS